MGQIKPLKLRYLLKIIFLGRLTLPAKRSRDPFRATCSTSMTRKKKKEKRGSRSRSKETDISMSKKKKN